MTTSDSSDSISNTISAAIKPEKKSANWTKIRKAVLLEVFIKFTNSNFTDNGFKTETWNKIVPLFNSRTNLAYERSQLQSKYNQLKKAYLIMELLRGQSGFGWDEATQTVTADEIVWAAYIAAHPDAAAYKNKPFEDYEELQFIFTGKVATGKYAIGSNSSFNSSASSSSSSAIASGGFFGVATPATEDEEPLEDGKSLLLRSASMKHALTFDMTGDDNLMKKTNALTSGNTSFSNPTSKPPTARAKPNDDLIKLLTDIKGNLESSNAPRRALVKFNQFVVDNDNDWICY